MLRNKVGHRWLHGEPDRELMIEWVQRAPIGELWHRDEDLWLEIIQRHAHGVLLVNYIDQQYEGLRLTFGDLNAMD